MMVELQLLRPHWLLALLPLIWVLWRKWQNQGESQSWRTVCDHRLLPYLLVGEAGRSNRRPLLVAAIAGLLSIIALSGPVWKKLPQPVMREHSALVVALDLSRSMDAADLRPSRLERARLKLLDLLQMRREGQTALLVYAAQPFVVTPLTDDAGTIAAQISALSTSMMPSQGSRTDRVLVKAEQLLKNAGIRHGDILLITDGIDKKQGAQAFQQLASAGHRISILGVGTREGAPIPKPDGGFFKNSAGDIVVVKLKEMELQQLARQGD
ncbi:MAG: VWA domain-containing protein, partial [Gammaproteobacteria bacterium]|nr:VWA domain-containing protein [Gammaproteobacteria bacterium]